MKEDSTLGEIVKAEYLGPAFFTDTYKSIFKIKGGYNVGRRVLVPYEKNFKYEQNVLLRRTLPSIDMLKELPQSEYLTYNFISKRVPHGFKYAFANEIILFAQVDASKFVNEIPTFGELASQIKSPGFFPSSIYAGYHNNEESNFLILRNKSLGPETHDTGMLKSFEATVEKFLKRYNGLDVKTFPRIVFLDDRLYIHKFVRKLVEFNRMIIELEKK